jgi:hypothetical protein
MTSTDWIDISEPYYSFHGYRLTFTWKGATDNRAVTMYYLYRNGQMISGCGSNANAMILCATTKGNTYTFRAKDAAGNYSPDSNSFVF